MVAAFDYCLHGRGGAAPSIDTAMHGLVDAPHVDHLHPDAGIALATAADGEALTKECFGDRVLWVPWRRPGFQLGLDIAAVQRRQPAGHRRDPRRARHHRVGRHQRGVRGATRWRSSAPPAATSTEHGRPEPFGPVVEGYEPLPAERAARAGRRAARCCAGWPPPTGRRSATSPTATSCSTSSPRERHPRAGRAGHLLPRPLPAHQGPAAGAGPAADGAARRGRRAAAGAARSLPRRLPRLLRAARRAGQPADARRRPGDRAGARRRDVQLRRGQADRPGRRRVLRQRDQRDARRRGGLDVRADRRGARSSASSTGRWRRPSCSGCPSRSRWRPGSRSSPAAARASAGPSRTGWPPRAPASSSPTATPTRPPRSPRRSAAPDVAVAVTVDVTDAGRGRRGARRGACSRSAASTWSSTTPGCRSPSRCWRPPTATGTCSTT